MTRSTRSMQYILTGCLGSIGIAAAGAWLGAWHWIGDILALPVAYYLLAALVLMGVFLHQRAWRQVAVAGSLLLLTSYQLTSYPHVQPVSQPTVQPNLRVLVYNIYYQNTDLAAVVDVVTQYDPDVVFLMEYSEAVQQQIEASFAGYPYRLVQPSRMTMGLALFSRVPIADVTVHRTEATRIPVYQAQLQLAGQSISFVGGHPWPPQLRWGALHRRQMQEIIRVAELASPPLIVAGDFNAVPWSATMRRLAAHAEVRPIRQAFDLTSTWRPIPGFGLALDHVLVSAEWQVLAQQYGPPGGSDHVPLIVDLYLR